MKPESHRRVEHVDSAEDFVDPVIEAYKKDVDRTLIRHNLRLSVHQRLENLQAALRDVEQIREAMRAAKRIS